MKFSTAILVLATATLLASIPLATRRSSTGKMRHERQIEARDAI